MDGAPTSSASSSNGSPQPLEDIKSCVADFRADRKWPDYGTLCDCFAAPQSTSRGGKTAGGIAASLRRGFVRAAIIRDASHHPSRGPAQAATPRFAHLKLARCCTRWRIRVRFRTRLIKCRARFA